MAEKRFPTRNVMALITGRNLGDMNGMFNVLDYMAGESISGLMVGFTVGVPQAQQMLCEKYPEFNRAKQEADEFLNEHNYEQWVDVWEQRYGPTIAIPYQVLSADWQPAA